MNIKNLFKNLSVATENLSAITENLSAVTEENITLKSGFTLSSWGTAKLIKYGKLCILHLWGFRTTSNITSDTEFATLDGEFKAIGGQLTAGNSSYANPLIRIDASGSLQVGTMTANVNYYGQLVFIKVGG